MSPTTNITLNDYNFVLYGIEQLAVILAVILVVSVLLKKKNIVPEKLKSYILLIVGFWTLAIVFQYVISAYNYVHTIRPLQKESERQSQGY